MTPAAVTLMICVDMVALTACGSRGPTGTSASASSPLALAQCMHAHGVSNFPDPTSGEGGPGFSVSATPGSSTVNVGGISFSGPAFRAAVRACGLFNRGGAAAQPTEAMRQRILALARCMRSHGVPDFPDPKFSAGGLQAKLPSDHSAPAFQQAVRTCRGH